MEKTNIFLKFKNHQMFFLNKRMIFFQEGEPVKEVQVENPEAFFTEVNDGYQTFNDQDLRSIKNQLAKYKEEWINGLSTEKKAEATRQWAYCLFTELRIRRADDHGNDYGFSSQLAVQSPETNREFGENKTVLDIVRAKLQIAAQKGNETTRGKAEKLLGSVNDIIGNMRPPKAERKEIRANFRLTDYLNVESKHEGWNIEGLRVSLTESEDMVLTEAGQNGYSFVTEARFDGRGGGNLILLKDGNPTGKVFKVHGLNNTMVGFSVD